MPDQRYLAKYQPFIETWSASKDPIKKLLTKNEDDGSYGVNEGLYEKYGGDKFYDQQFYDVILPMLVAMLAEEKKPPRNEKGKMRPGISGRQARNKYIDEARDKRNFGITD